MQTQNELPGSRGTVNFVMRCKFCKRESSARKLLLYRFFCETATTIKNNKIILSFIEFDTSPIKPYTIEDNGSFAHMAVIDCRGLELVDFEPRVKKYIFLMIILF
jgi:hypothetical protein